MENLIEITRLRKNISTSQAESEIKSMKENSRNDFHFEMMLRNYLEDQTHPFGNKQHPPIDTHLQIKE
jgi:hypothetical protein